MDYVHTQDSVLPKVDYNLCAELDNGKSVMLWRYRITAAFSKYIIDFPLIPIYNDDYGDIKIGAKFQIVPNIKHNLKYFKSIKCYFEVVAIIPSQYKCNTLVLFHNGKTLPLHIIINIMYLSEHASIKANQTKQQSDNEIFSGMPEPVFMGTKNQELGDIKNEYGGSWNNLNGFKCRYVPSKDEMVNVKDNFYEYLCNYSKSFLSTVDINGF